MTQAELLQALKSLGMPVAYDSFKEPTEPPFITYLFVYSSDLAADNKNAVEVDNFQVELYSRRKDLAAEKLIQDKFKELELPYIKREFFIESENLRQVIYEIQIIGG